MPKREELVNLLKDFTMEVSFTKVNGEKRVMNCTLREDLIPIKEENDSEKRSVKLNDNTIRVFDIEKKEWRSFRITSVNEVKILST